MNETNDAKPACKTFNTEDIYTMDYFLSCSDTVPAFTVYLIINQCVSQDYDGTNPGAYKLVASGSNTATFTTYTKNDCSDAGTTSTVTMNQCTSGGGAGSGGGVKASSVAGKTTFTASSPTGSGGGAGAGAGATVVVGMASLAALAVASLVVV